MKRTKARRWVRKGLFALVCLGLISLLPVVVLRFVDPPTSAFMLAYQWQARANSAPVLDYQWRSVESVSPQLLLAVVAAEDQHFPTHSGFDVKAITEVLSSGKGGKSLRGASTISQQVAKNLFLWNGRSWVRKGIEAYYTVLIELLWSKRRILEIYVNVAEFGEGVYGAEAAASQYFGVSAANLSRSQAARMAAVLPNPKRLLVAKPSAYVQRRQRWIVQQMHQLGGVAWLSQWCDVETASR